MYKNYSINVNSKKSKNESLINVKIIKPVIDLGSVPSDTVVSVDFAIINIGRTTLKVDFVNPDCMCTEYKYSKKPILPGDTLLLTLKVNTKNKIGEQSLITIIKLNTKEELYKIMLNMNVAY